MNQQEPDHVTVVHDTVGHSGLTKHADAESAEGEDDTQGHGAKSQRD